MKLTRKFSRATRVVAAIVIVAGFAGCAQHATQQGATGSVPQYQVDPFWPKPLKDNWIWGQVSSIKIH